MYHLFIAEQIASRVSYAARILTQITLVAKPDGDSSAALQAAAKELASGLGSVGFHALIQVKLGQVMCAPFGLMTKDET